MRRQRRRRRLRRPIINFDILYNFILFRLNDVVRRASAVQVRKKSRGRFRRSTHLEVEEVVVVTTPNARSMMRRILRKATTVKMMPRRGRTFFSFLSFSIWSSGDALTVNSVYDCFLRFFFVGDQSWVRVGNFEHLLTMDGAVF